MSDHKITLAFRLSDFNETETLYDPFYGSFSFEQRSTSVFESGIGSADEDQDGDIDNIQKLTFNNRIIPFTNCDYTKDFK